jgi:hypothetical protein
MTDPALNGNPRFIMSADIDPRQRDLPETVTHSVERSTGGRTLTSPMPRRVKPRTSQIHRWVAIRLSSLSPS